jgi:hypothetical protein
MNARACERDAPLLLGRQKIPAQAALLSIGAGSLQPTDTSTVKVCHAGGDYRRLIAPAIVPMMLRVALSVVRMSVVRIRIGAGIVAPIVIAIIGVSVVRSDAESSDLTGRTRQCIKQFFAQIAGCHPDFCPPPRPRSWTRTK